MSYILFEIQTFSFTTIQWQSSTQNGGHSVRTLVDLKLYIRPCTDKYVSGFGDKCDIRWFCTHSMKPFYRTELRRDDKGSKSWTKYQHDLLEFASMCVFATEIISLRAHNLWKRLWLMLGLNHSGAYSIQPKWILWHALLFWGTSQLFFILFKSDWNKVSISINVTFLVIPDDVINWKHFPRYSPFVRGIH